MSEPASKVRPWDTNLPDYFSRGLYENGAIDAAINITASFTANKWPGTRTWSSWSSATPRIVWRSSSATGITPRLRRHRDPNEKSTTQEKSRPVLRSDVVGGIPDRILRLAEVNGSLRHHAHIFDILNDLRAKLPLTHRDLDLCMEGVKKPFNGACWSGPLWPTSYDS